MAVEILKAKTVHPSIIKSAPHGSKGLIKAFWSESMHCIRQILMMDALYLTCYCQGIFNNITQTVLLWTKKIIYTYDGLRGIKPWGNFHFCVNLCVPLGSHLWFFFLMWREQVNVWGSLQAYVPQWYIASKCLPDHLVWQAALRSGIWWLRSTRPHWFLYSSVDLTRSASILTPLSSSRWPKHSL